MTNSNTLWEVPKPLLTFEVRVDDDTVFTLRRHGNPDGPRLVMSHDNGGRSISYYPFWSLPAEEFDLVVYDLRNHGWNSVSTIANHNIPTLFRDHDLFIEGIDSHYGTKPKIWSLPFRIGADNALNNNEGQRPRGASPVRSSPVQARPQLFRFRGDDCA